MDIRSAQSALHPAERVADPADLYILSVDNLLGLDRFPATSAQKLV